MHKTALGAEDAVPWEYHEDPMVIANKIKASGVNLVLIEQTAKSKSIYDCGIDDFPLCFIVGNEVSGVSEELSSVADIHIDLPMRGIKQSLNVSVATGIVGYEFSRIYTKGKVKND